jgi:hypothetical protein
LRAFYRALPFDVAAKGVDAKSLKGGNEVASELVAEDHQDASCLETVLDLYRSRNAAASPRDKLMSRLLSYVYPLIAWGGATLF